MADIPQSSFQGPLAPKMGFGDSFKSPLHESENKPPQRKGGSIGKLIPIGAIALAILVLPLTLGQLGQQQDLRQRASEPVPTIILPTKALYPISPTPAIEIATPSASPTLDSAENPTL